MDWRTTGLVVGWVVVAAETKLRIINTRNALYICNVSNWDGFGLTGNTS